MGRAWYRKASVLRSMGELIRRIGVLPKLLRDPNVRFTKKMMVIGGLIYFLSPFDILADPILGLGFIDDTVLMLFIISKVKGELDKYIQKDTNNAKFEKEKIVDEVNYKIDDE